MGIDPSYGLFRLGVEQGGNLRLWRMAVDLQAERIREAIALDRERHDDGRWRVDADAHLRRRLERPAKRRRARRLSRRVWP
jgi:hypothetical protein